MPYYPPPSAGGGGGGLTAVSATTGTLTKWASATSLTNSILVENAGALTLTGNLTVASGSLALSGTVAGRTSRSIATIVDATGQGGSGTVTGTDDSAITLKLISGQTGIFDNDGGILSLPTSGAATFASIYGGQNPAITNVGGATTGSNTITLLVSEAVAAQGTIANATVTTAVGLDIGVISAGTTNNYGIRIAAPSGGSTNRAIDVAAGAFFVDGGGNVAHNGTGIIGGTSISGGSAQLYVTGSTAANATQMAGIWAQPTLTLSSGNLNANTVRTQANVTITSLAASLYNLAAVYVDGPTLSGGGATTTFGLPTISTSGLSRIFVEPLSLASTVATVSSAHGIYAFGPGGTGITTGYAAYFSAGTGSTNNYALGIGAQASPTTAALTITGAGNINTTGSITATGTFTAGSVLMANQSDVVGLTVRGFSTQTNNLQAWQTSASAVVGSISNNGNMGIGAAGSAAAMLLLGGTLAAPAASGLGSAMQITTTIPLTASATTGQFIRVLPSVTTTTGVNISQISGLSLLGITGSGGGTVTLTSLYGLYVGTQNAITGISTITNSYGAYIVAPSVGTSQYGLYISGVTAASQMLYAANAASSTVPLATFDASATTNAQKVIIDKTGHIVTTSGAIPSTGTLGTGVTSATIAAGSTDQSGKITFVVTASQVANSNICTVTFASAFATAPVAVMMVPADTATWGKVGTGQFFAGTISATSFIPKSGSTAAVAGTFVYYYHCL